MNAETATLQEQFNEEGYVILRGFFEPEVVQAARGAMASLVEKEAQKLKAAGKITDTLPNAPFETRLLQLYANDLDSAPLIYRPELHVGGLYPAFFHQRLLDIVESILGPEILLYPNYSSRPKYPDMKRAEVLWHQDGGYTESMSGAGKADALRMVNLWSPLVPAHTEHGCMQFIPQSHTMGTVPHAQDPKVKFLEIVKEHLAPVLHKAINIEMDPGDVVLFHNLLFHQGLPNRSKIIRWNLDWRYLDGTQETLRKEKGHLARSKKHPEKVVKSAKQWESLSFT